MPSRSRSSGVEVSTLPVIPPTESRISTKRAGPPLSVITIIASMQAVAVIYLGGVLTVPGYGALAGTVGQTTTAQSFLIEPRPSPRLLQ